MGLSEAVAEAVARAFAPSRGDRRIGAELELHLVGRDAPIAAAAVSARLPDSLVRRGCPTSEPGGQLELSLPPQRSVDALARELDWCVGAVRRAVDGEVVLAGLNPRFGLDEVPLARATPRYLAMQELVDRTGAAGRKMMRLTASLQICVDLLPGPAGREQWLVANLAGPALVAAYSGSLDRTRIWLDMDPARTAYDGRHLDPVDPVGAYRAYATAASRLPIPEARDVDYHLSTLFPPVRPRGGYLELRYLDSQPASIELLDTIWTLMYDDEVRGEALELLLPTLPDYWESWMTADPADLLAVVSSKGRVAA